MLSLQVVALQTSNVLFAMNLCGAFESFVDRMDLTRVVVAISDAYLHRSDSLAMAFELNWMEIVWTTMMMILLMWTMMTVLKDVKWVAPVSIVLVIVTCCGALWTMSLHRKNCDALNWQWMIVVVFEPMSNFLDYMIQKMPLRCHCDHRDSTYYRTMISVDLIYVVVVVVFVLIQYNLKGCNHHEHTNVFVLKELW